MTGYLEIKNNWGHRTYFVNGEEVERDKIIQAKVSGVWRDVFLVSVIEQIPDMGRTTNITTELLYIVVDRTGVQLESFTYKGPVEVCVADDMEGENT